MGLSRKKASAALLSLAGVSFAGVSLGCVFGIALCTQMICAPVQAAQEPAHPQALDDAIIAAAKRHNVPERLVRRIIMRESKYNPLARNRLYWGLMQISYPTARSMGFKGTPQELLNPVVNLRYAVPYLANAFVIAGKSEDAAVRLYAAGYYFTARSRGLLNALRTADSRPLNGIIEDQPEPQLAANAVVQPPQSVGIFGALFGPGSQPQPQPAQVVAYSADTTAAAPPAGTAPVAAPATAQAPAPGTFNGPTASMVADKKGEMAPPKKWTRDGGMTVIARGEQSLDKLASRDAVADAGKSRRRAHKFTAVAALDVPPSSAQAYAGATPAQDPRFAAAASQAAIAQATAGPAPTGQPVAVASQPDAAGEPLPVVQASVPVDETPKRKVRHARRKAAEPRTREARAEAKPDAAAQPELGSTAAQ